MSGKGLRIVARNLTKRFGATAAVADLTFDVEPGVVTGFLGPNGAGKTTTMRMILDLVRPTSGTATIGGTRYSALRRPATVVGAVLGGANTHPACTARDHLRIYATMGGLSLGRVDVVIGQLEMTTFADRPARSFSTGMKQRLSLATALLGDPAVLLLDEPGNGLDPHGLVWFRDLVKNLAAEGRTILISSHVLSELEQIADHVIVIRGGRLVTTGTLAGLAAGSVVLIRSPDADRLGRILREHAGAVERAVERDGTDLLRVRGFETAEIAEVATAHRLRIHELTPQRSNLEQVFLNLTRQDQGANR